jgi:hypothetical protein
MKNKNIIFLFILIVFISFSFSNCDFENQIIRPWWVAEELAEEPAEEPDYEYVTIIKDVPIIIYETIITEIPVIQTIIIETILVETIHETEYITLPPEILLQHIEIIAIDFIIFSGGSERYNGPFGAGASSNLTIQEQNTNNSIVNDVLLTLIDDPDCFLILHGHANPVDFTQAELDELNRISTARAISVRDAIAYVYDDILSRTLPLGQTPPVAPIIPEMAANHALAERMTTRGYGGGRNIAGSSPTYAGLNRRVEAILFKVTEDAGARMPGAPGNNR